jgi:hypothetical protein
MVAIGNVIPDAKKSIIAPDAAPTDISLPLKLSSADKSNFPVLLKRSLVTESKSPIDLAKSERALLDAKS